MATVDASDDDVEEDRVGPTGWEVDIVLDDEETVELDVSELDEVVVAFGFG